MSYGNLSLEQKALVMDFKYKVDKMNLAQCQEMLVELYEYQLIRDNHYKHLLKKEWGID